MTPQHVILAYQITRDAQAMLPEGERADLLRALQRAATHDLAKLVGREEAASSGYGAADEIATAKASVLRR